MTATLPGLASDRRPPAARPGQRPARGYASGKADYLSRLRKIEGQVRGLQRMIEADTWCPDVGAAAAAWAVLAAAAAGRARAAASRRVPLLIVNMAEAEAHAPVAAPVAELICEDAQVTKGCQKIGYS